MPRSGPRWGSSSVTASSSGAWKGTESFMGRSETPLSRGRMEPSDTKAASPCRASSSRMKCWSSARAMTLAKSSFGVRAYSNPCSTQTGRKSNRIFSSSRALMVRPLAGKPASKRRVTVPERTSQSVRSRTSWPGAVTAKIPLFPDPLAWREKCPAWRPKRRRR